MSNKLQYNLDHIHFNIDKTEEDIIDVMGSQYTTYNIELTINYMDERFRAIEGGLINSFLSSKTNMLVKSELTPSLDSDVIMLWGSDKSSDTLMVGYTFFQKQHRDDYVQKICDTLYDWNENWEGFKTQNLAADFDYQPINTEGYQLGVGYSVEEVVNENVELQKENVKLKEQIQNLTTRLKQQLNPDPTKINIY